MDCLPVGEVEWAEKNFRDCRLGDERRTNRLVRVAARMAADTSASLPDQMQNLWKEAKAAYRLLHQEEVTFEAVAGAHWELTRQSPAGDYLILSDATELDFGCQRQIQGVGFTGSGIGRGFMLHSALMVDRESGAVIGLAAQRLHCRQRSPKGETRMERANRNRESDLWRNVIEAAGPPPQGSRSTFVMDRGGDDFEVYHCCQVVGVDWLVRARHLTRSVRTPENEKMPLKAYLATLPVVASYELDVPKAKKRLARKAHLAVSFGLVTLPPPKLQSKRLKAANPQPIRMYVVFVREVNPPANTEPVEWVLYTSHPITCAEDALQLIRDYQKRWVIEEWHKCLKTGCRTQESQLQHGDRLAPLVALHSIVAVRLLQLRSLVRSQPDRPADEFMPADMITMVQRARQLPAGKRLTIGQFFRGVAGMGGFLGRKSDGEPGWITIWRGWEKLVLMLRGAELVEAGTPHRDRKCG